MERALQLARLGRMDTSPNPMVGAVIVHDGRIIGEGYHRRCGEGHAEVNAIASVLPDDLALLPKSTMYVTLEPCSHYGKTPPCAKLLVEKGIRRVVVGSLDPNPRVSGRGVQMLRDAGAEVMVGVMEEECSELNRRFMTCQVEKRPFVTLKLAQTADGYMGVRGRSVRISNALTSLSTARLRAEHDAIVTTQATYEVDHPRLNVRLWDGRDPKAFVIASALVRGAERRDAQAAHRFIWPSKAGPPVWPSKAGPPVWPSKAGPPVWPSKAGPPIWPSMAGPPRAAHTFLQELWEQGVTSVLVEAGPRFLQAMLDEGVWDQLRVETSPLPLAEPGEPLASPRIPAGAILVKEELLGGHRLQWYRH
ncbi:MAG: bifunctional diaminohydroxyphosphoribosylaminopyrimidine deaminase/5-amino-6-(5-phosphoribosylamino)uracil reductase RibD [Bacteroidales bacterium]|nr:bifunctional diaminohydroxyphosphoribosylaminopyrimidine deaminase/5-amino-6-(5-phosphoribosylamino)uracil reductase RibD [Bacteroidales bacterium]